MAQSTGPILATGAITWTNQVILSPAKPDIFVTTARIGIATGILAGMFYMLEKGSPTLAVGLAWTGLVTSLFVRFNNRPTPLERAVDLVG